MIKGIDALPKTGHVDHLSTSIIKRKKLFVEIASAFFIFLFFYTAVNKLIVSSTLEFTLSRYPIIGGYSIFFAWAIPILELITTCLLFIPKLKKTGLYFATLLMFLFTIYVSYMIAFVPELPCTCGGMLTKLSWPGHLIFNIACVAIGVTSIIIHNRSKIDFER